MSIKVLLLSFALTVGSVLVFLTPSAQALDGFQASTIISDATFSDTAEYTESKLQNLFVNINPSCSSSLCIKNYKQSGVSAAAIIHNAGISNNVNPLVLAALLEAQTGLLTSTNPTQSKINSAMGFPGKTGFEEQINAAASFLSDTYHNQTGTFIPNSTYPIPYSTLATCEKPLLTLTNNSTAAIYSYPAMGYQPNKAALDAGRGQGDACSTYGIRNFYINYSVWSGKTIIPAPVYRFWSATKQKHFYTVSTEEESAIIAKWPDIWQYEGIAYSVPDGYSGEGLSPVYRFWSNSKQSHFYTASSAERDAIINKWPDIWQYEGIAYNASTNATSIMNRSVYRFWSARNQTHFYTTSDEERTSVQSKWPDIWQYEGIAYYVK